MTSVMFLMPTVYIRSMTPNCEPFPGIGTQRAGRRFSMPRFGCSTE